MSLDDPFFADETSLLVEMLEKLSDTSCSATIQDWDQAGSVYLDYLRIASKMQQLAEGKEELSQYLLEQLQSGVERLAVRIGRLPYLTPAEV